MKKLFEHVDGNQFKLIKEEYDMWDTNKGSDVDISEVPLSIDQIFDTKRTKYVGDPNDANSVRWVDEVKKSAKVFSVKKVQGYGVVGDGFRKTTPDDFFYEVEFAVVEPGWKAYDNEKIEPLPNHWLFGVSKDGKKSELFAS